MTGLNPTADNSTDPNCEDSDPQPVRLSIRQLMVWTACCAVFISTRGIWNFRNDAAFANIVSVINALWAGTSIFGGVTILECWFRRLPCLDSPGAWLLAANGLVTATRWIERVVVPTAATFSLPTHSQVVAPLAAAISILVASAMMLFALLRFYRQRGWNTVLMLSVPRYALALNYLPTNVILPRTLMVWWFLLLLVIWLAFVAGFEFFSSTRRNWIHWLGVGITLASLPIEIAVRSCSVTVQIFF